MFYPNIEAAKQIDAIVSKLDDLQSQRNKLVETSRPMADCEPSDFEHYKTEAQNALAVVHDTMLELSAMDIE